MTTFHTIQVDGLDIFYREAGSPNHPTILLLHGFPTSKADVSQFDAVAWRSLSLDCARLSGLR